MIVSVASIAEILDLPPGTAPSRDDERRAAGILAERMLSGLGAHFSRDEKLLPVWPEGFSGSISHCRGEAAAAVRRGAPLGIDLEEIGRVSGKLFYRIAAQEEIAAYDALKQDSDACGEFFRTAVFSAKEAFWKLVRNSGGGSPAWREIVTEIPVGGSRLTVRGAGMTASGEIRSVSGKKILVILEEKR